MSKERLEEITSSVGILLSGDRHVLLRRKHYEWLIEQAERVADYEKRYEKHLDIDIRNDHKVQCLEYQIKRYREALEEIKELTRFDDGSKEKEYEIACKALEGDNE